MTPRTGVVDGAAVDGERPRADCGGIVDVQPAVVEGGGSGVGVGAIEREVS